MAVKSFIGFRQLTYFIAFLIITSCKEKPSTTTEENAAIEQLVEKINTPLSQQELDSIKNVKAAEFQKPVFKYVNAPSGLNFRDVPDGEVLGKFPLNTRVEIIESTGFIKTIEDNGKRIQGNWVKVGVHKAIGYVFDGFLSDDYVDVAHKEYVNDLSIMTVNGYEIGDHDIAAFISLTDGYWNNRFPKVLAEYENENNKNQDSKELVYYLKGKERTQFLSNREIKETDNLYIYNYLNDNLKVVEVKDVPLLSHESIYGGPDYLTGFDVQGIIDTSTNSYYNSFAHIGTTNPFKEAGISAIEWKKTDIEKMPKVELEYGNFYKSKNYEVLLAYHDIIDENNYYYMRASFDNKEYIVDYIIVIAKSGKLLYKTEIGDSEGYSPSIYLSDNLQTSSTEPVHYSGLLFENKPPVIFGLYYTSFGCPFIDFLDSKELPVYIQCDNRH
ncbi:MAG: SH3 domain-containing protein [Nonlabens sp.]|uniref:SH3 domain-containing protein n=1 Tax=Nonlabens sp. TaxID=1888209 RepID=UPI003EF4004C